MPDFKKQKLSDCIDYVNEKINIEELNDLNYISTENMLPNRGGITKSSGLPNANYTQCFSEGDILLSNIRPYFKKIWYATFNGGCSNDVLVLRAKSNMYSKFLYYVLSDDKFFEYDTATSKGTKMPRGDKVAIMKYGVPQYDLPKQKKIARVLSSLDDKIELNNKINQNLEQQAQAIFKSWFVDFEPFGGKMPDDWRIGKLEELTQIKSGKRPQLKQADKDDNFSIPIIGASTIMGYTNAILYNEPILITGRVGTHGIINKYNKQCWPSDNTLVIKSKYYEYIYQQLKRIDFAGLNRGSTQPLITQKDLLDIDVVIPTSQKAKEYEQFATQLSIYQDNLITEKEKLTQLRDTLLPKLMNGEIDVDKIWNSTTALRQSILA